MFHSNYVRILYRLQEWYSDIGRKLLIFVLCSTPPLKATLSDFAMMFGTRTLEWWAVRRKKVYDSVYTDWTNARTDRQTDRQTMPVSSSTSRLTCNVSCGQIQHARHARRQLSVFACYRPTHPGTTTEQVIDSWTAPTQFITSTIRSVDPDI